jgi:hypothetical protein
VYTSAAGHLDYNDAEAILSPREVVKSSGVAGGTTLLAGMPSGAYKGFVIYQASTNNTNLGISPQSPLAVCSAQSATWMTDGVPGTMEAGNAIPDPCGDLGGISGTIYSPGASAQVQVTATGLADLQIVAGKILITNGADARFTWTPTKFALGYIRLVE